jgi:hypothetical protein
MDPEDTVDDDRTRLVASLLRQAHEQGLEGPEPAPFWREGPWRCEFHRYGGQERLKVFRGERCVHEEIVQGETRARARSDELREVLMREPDHTDSGNG